MSVTGLLDHFVSRWPLYSDYLQAFVLANCRFKGNAVFSWSITQFNRPIAIIWRRFLESEYHTMFRHFTLLHGLYYLMQEFESNMLVQRHDSLIYFQEISCTLLCIANWTRYFYRFFGSSWSSGISISAAVLSTKSDFVLHFSAKTG